MPGEDSQEHHVEKLVDQGDQKIQQQQDKHEQSTSSNSGVKCGKAEDIITPYQNLQECLKKADQNGSPQNQQEQTINDDITQNEESLQKDLTVQKKSLMTTSENENGLDQPSQVDKHQDQSYFQDITNDIDRLTYESNMDYSTIFDCSKPKVLSDGYLLGINYQPILKQGESEGKIDEKEFDKGFVPQDRRLKPDEKQEPITPATYQECKVKLINHPILQAKRIKDDSIEVPPILVKEKIPTEPKIEALNGLSLDKPKSLKARLKMSNSDVQAKYTIPQVKQASKSNEEINQNVMEDDQQFKPIAQENKPMVTKKINKKKLKNLDKKIDTTTESLDKVNYDAQTTALQLEHIAYSLGHQPSKSASSISVQESEGFNKRDDLKTASMTGQQDQGVKKNIFSINSTKSDKENRNMQDTYKLIKDQVDQQFDQFQYNTTDKIQRNDQQALFPANESKKTIKNRMNRAKKAAKKALLANQNTAQGSQAIEPIEKTDQKLQNQPLECTTVQEKKIVEGSKTVKRNTTIVKEGLQVNDQKNHNQKAFDLKRSNIPNTQNNNLFIETKHQDQKQQEKNFEQGQNLADRKKILDQNQVVHGIPCTLNDIKRDLEAYGVRYSGGNYKNFQERGRNIKYNNDDFKGDDQRQEQL